MVLTYFVGYRENIIYDFIMRIIVRL